MTYPQPPETPTRPARTVVLPASVDTPTTVLLSQIVAQVVIALEALADEHEGDFKRALAFIQADADALVAEVASW